MTSKKYKHILEITKDNRHLIGFTDDCTEIEIPEVIKKTDGITYKIIGIGADCFLNARKLEKVIIAPGVEYIKDNAFNGCINLSEVFIPDSVEEIGKSVFEFCVKLIKIKMPERLKNLSDRSFAGCQNLVSVILPSALLRIGNEVFLDCIHLKDIAIPKTVALIEATAFENCKSIENFTIEDGNRRFVSINGVLFADKKTVLVVYPGGKKDKKYRVPNETLTIKPMAFSNNSHINQIEFADTVNHLWPSCIKNCKNLEAVKLPEKIKNYSDTFLVDCKKAICY